MNIDIRLSVGFWQHPKVFRLERRLGLKGVRSLQILWCWCAQNRPDGNLADLAPDEIEFVADWRGKKGAFFEACVGEWIDETEANSGYALHEWTEYNPWQAQAGNREEARKAKARNAANARWGKEKQDDANGCPSNATSNANNDSSICSNDAQAYANGCPSNATSNAQKMPSLTSTSTRNIKGILNTPPYPPQAGDCESSQTSPVKPVPPEKPRRQGNGNSLPELQAAIDAYTENDELVQALDDWRLMRERIRKPLTGRAIRAAFAKLDSMAPDDAGKIAILEQSIFNSWQGLFPLREETDRARASPSGNNLPAAPTEYQRRLQERRLMSKMLLEQERNQEPCDEGYEAEYEAIVVESRPRLPDRLQS